MMRPKRYNHVPKARRGRSATAFTLIETAMAVIIIGVGVIAMVDAQHAFIISNSWSSHASAATLLAGEIREMTRRLPRHDPVTGLYLDAGGALVGWGPENGEITVLDYDDLDDFDGARFGHGGDFDGPINAFGEIIFETDGQGNILVDPDTGLPVPLRGWSQTVIVEKIDPFDTSVVRTDEAVDPPSGSFPGRGVDQFPLRVTVIVEYQSARMDEPEEVTRISWIVP